MPDGLRAIDTWKNVGNGTPAAAFETLFWAKEHIDNVVLGSLISVSPNLRAKADEVFIRIPQATRSRLFINNPEQLVAFVYALGPLISGFRIDGESVNGPASVRFTGEFQMANGRMARFGLDFTLEPGGWKLVLDDNRAYEMLERVLNFGPSAKE